MKNTLSFVLLLFSLNTAISQTESTQFFSDYLSRSSKIDGLFKQTAVLDIENIGNPYLYRSFTQSTILLKSGEQIKDAPARFNIFANRVELKDKESVIVLDKPFQVEKMVLNDRVFIYSLIVTNKRTFKEINAKWFELLVTGELQLLGLHNKEIKTDSYALNYMGGGGTKQKFLKESMYLYLKAKDGPATRFFPSRKKLLSILRTDIKEPVTSFMKSNKIKLSRLDDLIKTMVYINSLLDSPAT